MAARATRVVEWSCGHRPQVSRPGVVADLVAERVAERVVERVAERVAALS